MPPAQPPATAVEADRPVREYVREPHLADLTGFWTESIEHRHDAFNSPRALPGLPFFPEPALWNQHLPVSFSPNRVGGHR
jgi:hypothetical protein